MLIKDFLSGLKRFIKMKRKSPVYHRKREASIKDSYEEFDEDNFYDFAQAPNKIEDFIKNQKKPAFAEKLFKYIDASGKKDSEVYTRAYIDRRLFAKIRSNKHYHPSKQTALALCLALELSFDEAEDLMTAAGYTLTESETFDLVIIYCINNRIYDLTDVNEALDYFSLKPIGVTK
jgi:hypothetical protein